MFHQLDRLADKASVENIQALTRCFVKQLDPLQIFLFGSFADGSHRADSDYDFYIVMQDGSNVGDASDRAYKSIRHVQNRPVDIVVGTKTRFDRMGPSMDSLHVESEVFRKGLLLYNRTDTGGGVSV